MEQSSGGLRPQMMNVIDCTRGQMERVLWLPGIEAGAIATAACSLKPAAICPEQEARQDLVLWVLQGVGTCQLRDPAGNGLQVRLRRGTHFAVPRGAAYQLENGGRALLVVVQATAAR